MRCCVGVFLLAAGFAITPTPAQDDNETERWPWHQFIEPDFPFFSMTVDARSANGEAVKDNLIARAMVVPLGDDCFLAYDVDLLRVAAVWTADEMPFVNANMACNSYPYNFNKVRPGLGALPQPKGDIWFQNGIYAGVGAGTPQIGDPRPARTAEDQVRYGGLDRRIARFLGIDLTHGLEIRYEIAGRVRVNERFEHVDEGLIRRLQVGPHSEPIYVVIAENSDQTEFQCRGAGILRSVRQHVVCCIEPSKEMKTVSVLCTNAGRSNATKSDRQSDRAVSNLKERPARRWKQSVRLSLPAIQSGGTLNLEELPLPLENPYGRAVRAADISFFGTSGRAALVTFDGDVWLCDGLQPRSQEVVWTRFTSGLHEPLSIRIRDGEIFVFDRSGLWRLHDRDENGEADYHELFCSRIYQSAETRDFPLSFELETDGSFLVSKSGQRGMFSAILRISADGNDVKLIASGFRQPYLGYDPETGQIAATDQQGDWVPSTPVSFIKQDGFYGFRRSETLDDRPVTPPLTWIPHAECGSAASMVWMRNAEMGPLNNKPIVLCYQPPRIMQLHTDVDEFAIQGGATPLDLNIGSNPLLKAAINPADGLLYLTGFKVWGSLAEKPTFFGRIRTNSSKPWSVPSMVKTARRGILLGFDHSLDPLLASNRAAYTVRRWNYKRTSQYGSGHYRLDGTAGSETLPVSSVKLSRDRRSVFLGIAGMREVMQIEVSYDIAVQEGEPFRRQTFLTANVLREVDLAAHGFINNEVDLSKRAQPLVSKPAAKPTIQRGARLYRQVGCIGCHSVDGSVAGKNGPSWLGLYGSQRKLIETGQSVTADEDYLRESILNPAAKIVSGAVNGEAGMPIYAGVLDDDQIDSLLLFIRALAAEDVSSHLVASGTSVTAGRDWVVNDFRDDLLRPLSGRSFQQGKLVFLGASCFSCHRIGEGKGGTLGPDLAKLDEKLRGLELLTHILEPSRKIDDKFKSRSVVTLDGRLHKGFVVFEDETEIRITSDPLSNNAPIVVLKNEIEEMRLSNVSPMPKGALNQFDQVQILDLLAYIESRGNPDHRAFAR
ncbi:MAG: c-type cytochrome [Fuerstiella sp.]|nr:c-type cytochrome [Fuerstiella sp.]